MTLRVPPEALSESVRLRVDGSFSEDGEAVFSLLPHSTQFSEPVTLEIDAESTTARAGGAVVLWRGPDGWEALPTRWRGKTAIAQLRHFSDYGLGLCIPVADDTEDGCRPVAPSLCDEEQFGCYGQWVNGWTLDVCGSTDELWYRDDDSDLLDNFCEEDLAAAFAPLLRTSSDCNWDNGLNRQGGEYLYAVEHRARNRVTIAYLPAYYRDCGSAYGAIGGGAHSGDSEIIGLTVLFNGGTNRWELVDIFLSAHCGTTTGPGRCELFSATQVTEWVEGRALGAPVVFVSRDKHANYLSRQACEAGILPVDTCPPNGAAYRFSVQNYWPHGRGNIGSRANRLIDETLALSGSSAVSTTRVERIWQTPSIFQWASDEACGVAKIACRFNGWVDAMYGDPAVPYGLMMVQYIGL